MMCKKIFMHALLLVLSCTLKEVECVKIAVVGGGMAGLVVTKYAKSLGLDVTTFEQTNDTGGVWVYSDQTGKDKNGLNVHSAMYKNLRVNVPNQLMGFLDFDFKNSTESSYSTGEEMYTFLKRYAEHFGLNENIKFEHLVTSVIPLESGQWGITVKNLVANETIEDIYDAVFVCNGHFYDPKYPKIPGLEYFHGEAIHSHDYRRPETYSRKVVLVIGSGASGTDIAIDLSATAQKVLFSHHKEQFPDYSENVVQKPDVHAILSDGTVQFSDGSVEVVDAIIFCTGYHYVFPFLTPDSHISVDENHVQHLYKHVVNINHPTMFLIGIPFNSINTFTMEYQAQFSLHWLLNPEKRPTIKDMIMDNNEDVQNRIASGLKRKQMHKISDIPKFYEDLSNFAEIPTMKPVYGKMYKTKDMRMKFEPVTFRRYYYQILNDDDFSEEFK